jgi:hypothetical protein
VIAIASLLMVVTLSLIVTRVATVVLAATGLSREAARFQARSALTGTGFTTREAESIVSHPTRRKVVMLLMLLGNAGIVAAASSLIIGFRGGSAGQVSLRVVELMAGMLVLVVLSRSRRVDRWLTQLIARFVRRHTTLGRRDLSGLLQLSGDYAVDELAVMPGDWMAGRRLGDLALRDEGIVVLGITRADGRYLGAPIGETEVLPGDVLVVYGRGGALADLDDRQRGVAGDTRHEQATRRQNLHELAVQRGDESERKGEPGLGSGEPGRTDDGVDPGAPQDVGLASRRR